MDSGIETARSSDRRSLSLVRNRAERGKGEGRFRGGGLLGRESRLCPF